AYTLLLNKYTGQEDIVVGSPIAGRVNAELQGIVGMFTNTIAIRNQFSAELTYLEFLKIVKENSLEAFENQEYQFEKLVDKVCHRKDMSRNPIFDVMFALQNMGDTQLDLDKAKTSHYRDMIGNISKFDLTLVAVENGNEIECEIEYSTNLFKKET